MSAVSSALGPKLLLVDDDAAIRLGVGTLLRALGYAATEAVNGRECLNKVEVEHPDLVLLDLVMPEMDGWQALAALRASAYAGGIIVLAGGDDPKKDVVRALSTGADDYVTKPYDVRELAARVNAVLRRFQRASGGAAGVLQFGATRIDLAARTAEANGARVRLTRTEFKLLEVLAAQAGHAVSREELLEKVWHYAPDACTRTVDTYMWRLRQKICPAPHTPRWLHTTPGGYRLDHAAAPNGAALSVEPTVRVAAAEPKADA